MAMKDFRVALEDETVLDEDGEERSLSFTILGESRKDGKPFVSYYPTETQIALYVANFGEDRSSADSIAGTFDLMKSAFDTASYEEIRSRLRDVNDLFGIRALGGLMEGLIEEWTGHPTKPSSGSTPSRRTGGRTSTGNSQRPASTRSRSVRPASTT